MNSSVNQMFADIAHRYDITNDVLSFGTHRKWKKQVVKAAAPKEGEKFLDVCCGTGDLCFSLSRNLGATGKVTGLDFVPEMLEIASQKLEVEEGFNCECSTGCSNNKQSCQIEFICGDAMELPFADSSFDGATISFGIRNVEDPLDSLKEIRRVLSTSGRAIVLEFGQPHVPVFSSVYNLYSKYIIPRIGRTLTGNRAAYEYLPETSKYFPCGDEFSEILSQAGFSRVTFRPLFGGVAYLYKGVV